MIFIVRQDINAVFSGVAIQGVANTSHEVPNDKAPDVAREMQDAGIRFDVLSRDNPDKIKEEEAARSTFAVKKRPKKKRAKAFRNRKSS